MTTKIAEEKKKRTRDDFNLTDKQKNLLDRIKNESHRIAHLVGYDRFTELHAKWLHNMITEKDIYVLKAHRGSFKSSVVTLFIALLIICKPNKTIIFMRKTDNDVKEIVEKVSKILHTPQFQAFSQILYGHGYNFTKDTAFEINTTLKSDLGGKSQLLALGSSGSLTGKHSDYIIVDDLCFVANTQITTINGDKNIQDIKVGDKVLTSDGYQEVIRISQRQAEVICNVGLCGTPNHPVYSKIDNCYKDLKDIKENETVKLNDKQYECQNLTGVQTVYNIEVANTHNYYANGILVHNCNIKDRASHAERERIKSVWMELQNVRNRNGVSIVLGTTWHKSDVFSLMPPADVYTCYDTGLMSQKEIDALKKTMTPALFAANYELKFIANEDAIFTDIRYLKPSDMTEQEIKDGVKPKDLLDGCVAHLDASYGGDDTTALTLMKKLSDGRIIAFGKIWDKHVKHCMNDITMLCNFYNYRTLWMETNGDKGYLAKEFRDRGMKVMTYHEKMNKDVKIQTYLYGAWQDIYWLEETDPNYVNQIMDYTENAEIVDAPDSGACACRLLNKGKVKALSGFDLV
mgnify:CR=1 FL=1